MTQSLAALAATMLCAHGIALASPTVQEFLPCHRLAADVLQRCLDQRPGYHNDECWERAKTAQRQCYRQVSDAHAPDKARVDAEKKAIQASKL